MCLDNGLITIDYKLRLAWACRTVSPAFQDGRPTANVHIPIRYTQCDLISISNVLTTLEANGYSTQTLHSQEKQSNLSVPYLQNSARYYYTVYYPFSIPIFLNMYGYASGLKCQSYVILTFTASWSQTLTTRAWGHNQTQSAAILIVLRNNKDRQETCMSNNAW